MSGDDRFYRIVRKAETRREFSREDRTLIVYAHDGVDSVLSRKSLHLIDGLAQIIIRKCKEAIRV